MLSFWNKNGEVQRWHRQMGSFPLLAPLKLTSLFVNRFEICSGISGIGYTPISTLLSETFQLTSNDFNVVGNRWVGVTD